MSAEPIVVLDLVANRYAAVGFLLIALSPRRMVQSQRRELGTLLAMGYRRPRDFRYLLCRGPAHG